MLIQQLKIFNHKEIFLGGTIIYGIQVYDYKYFLIVSKFWFLMLISPCTLLKSLAE